MSIAQKQLINGANEVITTYLEEGIVPTLDTVLNALAEMFYNGAPGTPFTRFVPFVNESIIVPEDVNNLTQSINLDLDNLYQEGIDQVNRIARAFDYKDTFRNRLTQRMMDITQRLSATKPFPPYTINNIISSLENVDLINTNALIDFDTFTISLPTISNTVQIVSLQHAHIHYAVNEGTTHVISGVHHLKSTIGNSTFLVRSHVKDKKACKCKVTITLPKPEIMSHLDLDLQISGPTQVIVDLDGEPLNTQNADVMTKLKWSFSARAVKHVAIHLIKKQADAIHGHHHIFDFGIKSVVMYYDQYQYQATFQTTGLIFPSYLNQITLTANGHIPAMTAIDWSYSLGNSGQFVPLVPETPTSQITLVIPLEKRALPVKSSNDPSRIYFVNPDLTVTPTDSDLPVNSTRTGNLSTLFNICSLDPSTNNSSVYVLRGHNSWYVQAYHYTVHDKQHNQAPNLKDLRNPRGKHPDIRARYQPTEFDFDRQYPQLTYGLSQDEARAIRLPAYEYPTKKNNDRVMHIFNARIITSELITSKVLHDLGNIEIPVPNILANNKGTIYFNGQKRPIKLKNLDGNLQAVVTLPFRFGTNYINIVTNNYNTLGGAPFDFGNDLFTQYCAEGGLLIWYGDTVAMKQVSLYELQYQTNRNDFTRFAVTDDTTTNDKIVVTREMPTTAYNIFYQIAPDTTVVPIVIRAVLTGDATDPTISPVITNFSLVNSQ